MKPLMIVGILLIVLGIGGLALRNIQWTETETVADIGPIQIQADEVKRTPRRIRRGVNR